MTAVRGVAAYLVVLLVVLGVGCLPAARWAMAVPVLTPADLASRLAGPNPPLVLDVRGREDFLAGHIPGARSVPLEGLEGYLSRGSVPANRFLVICDVPRRVPLAGATAAAWHRGPVAEVAGGLAGWLENGCPLEKGEGEVVPAELMRIPTKELSVPQQAVASVLGLLAKPTYMLVCLVLIVALFRASAPPLRILFWALVSFEVGEVFCALDYFFRPAGFLLVAPLDLLHSAGMVGLGVLAPWAVYRLVIDRFRGHTSPPQNSLPLQMCESSVTPGPARCKVQQLVLTMLPAFAVLALFPLSLPLRPLHYSSQVFLSVLDFGYPILNEFVDFWGYAILGALSFLAAIPVLWQGTAESTRSAELPIFLGLGLAGFALWQFGLHNLFRENLIAADLWEEITEFVAIGGIASVLVIFRVSLGLSGDTVHPADGARDPGPA